MMMVVLCKVCIDGQDNSTAMQIMLMEVSDRIREQLGTSYPQDGPLQKFTAAMPSVLS